MISLGLVALYERHMTGFEIYVFVLCLVVFTLLTAMFTYLIASLTKMEIQFIRYGHRDEERIIDGKTHYMTSGLFKGQARMIEIV